MREQIGADHLTNWYGVWDDANDIDCDDCLCIIVLKVNLYMYIFGA